MGDMDLVRPIVAAGIRCAVVARPGSPSLHSRHAQACLPWSDFSDGAEELVEKLLDLAKTQPVPPVLFYEDDAQLLLISRFRDRLAQSFRFVIADAELVDNLVDKARFQDLAERHSLPVPAARRFHPATQDPDTLALRFPIVLKPLTRLARWNDNAGLHKAFAAENAQALRALWPQLVALDVELLAQELIPGAESQIESYHCYVERGGAMVAEFTGRKIRTCPPAFGHTTALEITDAADVRRQGRAIAERLGLTGVAKFDFKRDAAGTLHLLEINPRFTLWHHAAAVAGLNIPALVYADLTGLPRRPVRPARPGMRWCRAWTDFSAARAMGMSLGDWLAWTWRCEAKSSLSWDDPLLLPRATWQRVVGRRFGAATTRADWVAP
jgi:predicted ATP-grasp superfamily ATP-dependent carboligase